ncbi:MerR family transcriptional regulator [Paramicrobacterium fandaimingii]|uniref:MerR family transcriptional regulator n=1 Tax=Paramicrobacterium fandaimingii TaxID=2708079 RepID=UPI00141EB4B6|nr:MerR family transcriptional regulator [Microbacterium fandaimingii]
MHWSIHEIAQHAGTTSRTLRHYDHIGILEPSRIGPNGYRYYDDQSLVRLQRILLLRELGLGLSAIADVIDREADAPTALRTHLTWLRREHDRISRQISSVENTISTLEKGEGVMAENMFDGFDHTQYKDEVEERWGKNAYARSDEWWRGMSDAERSEWQQRQHTLASDWADAAERGVHPDSDEAQSLARRHAEWLSSIPGTPGSEHGRSTDEYLLGLGEMYVADPRFAKNYGGQGGAAFVRNALATYVENRRGA